MKKLLVLVLVLSITLGVPCFASAAGFDSESIENYLDNMRTVGTPINETLKNKRDALVEEYLSLPENEKETFLMQEALPLLMDEVKSIPELKESLTISQQEMAQVTEFLNTVNGDTDLRVVIDDVNDIRSTATDYYEEYLANATNELTIVSLLCANEGLSTLDLIKVNNAKNDAIDLAITRFPLEAQETTYMDSLRHFSWNYYMTKRLSKTKARTVGNNYEWARVLYSQIKREYDEKYDEEIASGTSPATAGARAASYAQGQIFFMKETTIMLCEANLQVFRSFFSDAAVRDLHNNCYGRAYAERSTQALSDESINTDFSIAWAAGEIIMSDADVTYDHCWCVWDWDWYT